MNTTQATTIGFTKEVRYDAITRDFCALVNGQILGWARTYLKAQELCNEYVYIPTSWQR